MKAVNLYVLSRDIDDSIFSLYEKTLSDRESELRIHAEEIEIIKTMISQLSFYGAKKESINNWFYSFTIPRIGKEFDLLKISRDKTIINIELKSQEVSEEKILKQLKRNRYYLSHISTEIYSYTFVKKKDGKFLIYKYEGGKVNLIDIRELVLKLNETRDAIEDNIEKYFSPKEYLVSPLNTPDSFIRGEYYLNSQQEEIKNSIISKNDSKGLYGIEGSAGTGKTLLIYDIAKELSKKYKVLIVHSGIFNNGHRVIDSKLSHVTLVEAKNFDSHMNRHYDVICVDETQRLYASNLNNILELYSENAVRACIFAYDKAQSLSYSEIKTDIPGRLSQLEEFVNYNLSTNIRTNEKIYSFVRNMMRLSDKSKKTIDYSDIDVIYANDFNEVDTIVDYYIDSGYKFITYTPSRYKDNDIDHFFQYESSHQVIGQEFDKVVIVIDNNFRYDENGELEGKEHPNPNYIFARLFYQNITRAREKLCIIVLNNELVFSSLIKIKGDC